MIVSIASGKGGTGKTTISTSLALSLKKVQFLDCDVEEPNAHFFIKPNFQEKISASILVPQVNLDKCIFCGKCAQVCAFKAIAVIKPKLLIFPELCHACGACSYLCPEAALYEVDKEIGYIKTGYKGDLKFVHGILNIGEVMSPPLIKKVKKYIDSSRINIIDAPPGTSCPVISAITNSNYCLLVTEPTPFGLNDLALAVGVTRKLAIPFGVIINRSDIGDNKVEEYCMAEGIPLLMKIPFRKEIAVAYSNGIPLIDVLPEYIEKFRQLYKEISGDK